MFGLVAASISLLRYGYPERKVIASEKKNETTGHAMKTRLDSEAKFRGGEQLIAGG